MESSKTGGVKPMAIAGRMVRERERLIGMTDKERSWRKQWLKDLALHDEPRHVPQLEKEFLNPIRRFYRAPLDKLCTILTPALGAERAFNIRFWTGKIFICTALIYTIAYYFKYNRNEWTRRSGWYVSKSRKQCLPGDEGYPKLSERVNPSDYYDRNFKNSPI